MKNNQDQLNLLRKISSNENSSQRDLAKELGFSLGKLNYCIKSLNKKGLIKIKNFKKNPNKLSYVYLVTPKGINEKAKLTINFMKRKMKEYDELKREFDKYNETINFAKSPKSNTKK
tara:strand:- start:38 stop:388 length:351 start_codon:yes stop_codon:yes gene_type:complete